MGVFGFDTVAVRFGRYGFSSENCGFSPEFSFFGGLRPDGLNDFFYFAKSHSQH
jgi:hypothetical protein